LDASHRHLRRSCIIGVRRVADEESHEIALSDMYQARTTAIAEWNTSLASNHLALEAFKKSATGRLGETTPIEARAGVAFVFAAMQFYENSQYQNKLGFLPDEHWDRARRSLKINMQDPFWRENILSQKSGMRSSFVVVLDEIEK
jgi:hypothetical protein